MSNLSDLVCGNVKGSGNLARSLRHLAQTLTLLERHLRRGEPKRRPLERLVCPFLIRSIIEVACTSLIGRRDPFRILTLAEIQSQGDYLSSGKVAATIQWTGDVLAGASVKNLWSSDRKTTDMTRALLGDYQDHIFWQPAFLRLSDHLASYGGTMTFGDWTRRLLNTEPKSLVPQFRGTASETYAAASKGVHHEFVLSMSAYYDDATLEKLTEDSLWLVATMGVVANFDESTAFALTPGRSVKCYEELQR